MNLLAAVLVFETLEAQVADLDGLLLRIHVHGHVARHVHPRRLPDQDLEQDFTY